MKRLKLKVETMRHLTGAELRRVAAGEQPVASWDANTCGASRGVCQPEPGTFRCGTGND